MAFLGLPVRACPSTLCRFLSQGIKAQGRIIVRFKSHKKKTKLYKARKHLKSVSLNQYFHATNVVYINENLTYSRRELFAKVRKLRKIITGMVPGLWTAGFLLRNHRNNSKK